MRRLIPSLGLLSVLLFVPGAQAGSPPEITSLEPVAGIPEQQVTIRGVGFTGATEVRFASMTTTFTVISDIEIVTVSPPDARTGKVFVTTPAGTGESPEAFIVRPVILSFSPTVATEGDQVTLTGYNFTGTYAVGVAFYPAGAVFTVISDAELRLIVPAGIGAGSGPIVVSNPGGDAYSPTDIILVPPVPVITSFAPSGGPEGTPVTIQGLRFTDATSVRFREIEATYIVESESEITTVAPPGVRTGRITVTTPLGSAVSPNAFIVPGGPETEGINLSWDDCGEAGEINKTFACNTNVGAPFVLVASFTPPSGINQLVGIEAVVDFRTSVPMIPDWWWHGVGYCRGTTGLSVSSDFTAGPASCDDYWGGLAAGGFFYEPQYLGPDRARLSYQTAIAPGNEGPVSTDIEYYAFKVNLLRSKTTGTGSCSGCAVPMCIVLTSIQLVQPDEAGFNPVMNLPKDRGFVSWQGITPNCPNFTPVLASLVSAEVEPGRVRLEWLTEEITSARLERRRGTGDWATVTELRAGGDHKLRYEDVDVTPGTTLSYRLAVMAGSREILLGETSVTIPVEQKRLALSRTSGCSDPRTVSVSLTLARATPAKLELFDVGGRHVASRSLAGLGPGEHEVQLKADRPLGAGVFFMRLSQDGEKVTRRFAMTR